MWLFKSDFLEKRLSQDLHLKCVFPLWFSASFVDPKKLESHEKQKKIEKTILYNPTKKDFLKPGFYIEIQSQCHAYNKVYMSGADNNLKPESVILLGLSINICPNNKYQLCLPSLQR